MRRVDIPSWIVGESTIFRELLHRVERLAGFDVAVLVAGDTGTGKEVFSRLLHYLSARAAKPFIPVNVGALVDSLFENELFGHAAGAFTDARSRAKGLVELAEGGTLFLDEIDSLSPHGQAALLRFLQERVYRPVGSTREISADVRVIAATNADLSPLLAAGRIRKDLYYRLSGITLTIPPLRQRPDDILPLARHFLADLSARLGRGRSRRLGPEMRRWLLEQPWPGNVRELRSAIEYSFIMSESDALLPPQAAPPREGPAESGFRAEKAKAVSQFERAYLERVMRQFDGNVSRAARAAGKERRGFDRLLRRHGIERAAFAPERT